MVASKAFLLAVFCVASAAATTVSYCDGGKEPLAVRVRGCNAEPCNFYRGEPIFAEWDFKVAKNTDNLKPKVAVTVGGMTFPYELPEQDACRSLVRGYCPLDVDEIATYALEMPIKRSYPKLGLTIQFSLVDESDFVYSCFKISAQVVDR